MIIRKKQKNNTTGTTGVYFDSRLQKYVAQIGSRSNPATHRRKVCSSKTAALKLRKAWVAEFTQNSTTAN